MFAGQPFASWDNDVTYKPIIDETVVFKSSWGSQYFSQTIPNTTNLFGFSSLNSPNFSKGVH